MFNSVCDHINSFPGVPLVGHYCRKGSKKHFLAHDLNIKRLYIDMCNAKCIPAVKQGTYRHIFCENFNVSFYKPKKDQCSLCAKYLRHKKSDSLTDELKMEYAENQKRKVVARNEKEKAKQKAKKKDCVATFDLQAVLITPCSLVSELYYSLSYVVTIFTIFQLADKHVFCHILDETHSNRDSCEIAIYLLNNSQSVCSSGNVDEITSVQKNNLVRHHITI